MAAGSWNLPFAADGFLGKVECWEGPSSHHSRGSGVSRKVFVPSPVLCDLGLY